MISLRRCSGSGSRRRTWSARPEFRTVCHLVQRQVYECYTAVKRQRKYAWPVQRETGSPHWQSFEMTRKLSIMCSSARNSCVVVVVNGSFDAGLCVVFGGVAKVEVGEGVGALDRKSA